MAAMVAVRVASPSAAVGSSIAESAPSGGASDKRPPSRPLRSSGTTSPAQAISGVSIRLSAICQATTSQSSAITVSHQTIASCSPTVAASPAATQERRRRVASLSQPEATPARLADSAPANTI